MRSCLILARLKSIRSIINRWRLKILIRQRFLRRQLLDSIRTFSASLIALALKKSWIYQSLLLIGTISNAWNFQAKRKINDKGLLKNLKNLLLANKNLELQNRCQIWERTHLSLFLIIEDNQVRNFQQPFLSLRQDIKLFILTRWGPSVHLTLAQVFLKSRIPNNKSHSIKYTQAITTITLNQTIEKCFGTCQIYMFLAKLLIVRRNWECAAKTSTIKVAKAVLIQTQKSKK